MKQLKLFIGIGLVALATAAVAQKTTFKDRIFPGTNQEVVYTKADYRSEYNRMEMFADHVRNWFSPRGYQTYFDMSEAAMTFYFHHAEVIYEADPFVESWMYLPFENEGSEEVLKLESWMSEAFENDLMEYGPALEVWMSEPFERYLSEEVVVFESWMGESFENDLSDETLIIEEWMLSPYEIDEELEMEDWMANSWI
jgi:hypothetical protein